MLCISSFLGACTPTDIQIEQAIQKTKNASVSQSTNSKESGYILFWYADEYFDLAERILTKTVEGDTESAYQLLDEAAILVGEIQELEVSENYKIAKKYLASGTWFDSFSYIMMLEGMPKEDYEESMNDGMRDIYKFVEEMNKLGHDIKF